MPRPNASVEELIQEQGQAFEEFKKTMTAQLAELKKGGIDPVTAEKLAKIEKSMDDAIELKAKLEAAIAVERKEREDLELRLSRPGQTATSEAALLVADFQKQLNGRRRDLKKDPVTVDQKMFDEYKAAFVHLMRSGKEDLSPEEVKTLQVSIDPQGGYLVTPDTSGRIVKKVYETSPIRQIANVTTIGKDKLEGMEDLDEAGAAYEGELAPNSNEETPDVGKWDITVWNIGTHPRASSNLIDDADLDIEAWLADKVSNRFSRFENTKFCVGTGKIRGFVSGYDTALDAGSGVAWGSLGYIKTGANGAFNGTNPAHKIFELMGLLKEYYLNNARFVTRRAVITLMRQMVDTTGQYLWQPSLVQGTPEQFGGYPITRAEDMPALASNDFSMAFGDFKEGYQVVDRQGIRVLRDPFSAHPKVIFRTSKRTGGGVLNFEAIKLLKFAA